VRAAQIRQRAVAYNVYSTRSGGSTAYRDARAAARYGVARSAQTAWRPAPVFHQTALSSWHRPNDEEGVPLLLLLMPKEKFQRVVHGGNAAPQIAQATVSPAAPLPPLRLPPSWYAEQPQMRGRHSPPPLVAAAALHERFVRPAFEKRSRRTTARPGRPVFVPKAPRRYAYAMLTNVNIQNVRHQTRIHGDSMPAEGPQARRLHGYER